MLDSLGLDFGKKKKGSDDPEIRAAIEMLSTSIEAINQRLTGTNLDDSFNATLKEFLPRINKILQYLGQETEKMQRNVVELNNNFYKFEKNIEIMTNGLKQTITQQNAKTSDAIDKIDTTQTLITKTVENSNANFMNKLNQMIDIHLQEIHLLREQNANFIKRMDALEKSIQDFVKRR